MNLDHLLSLVRRPEHLDGTHTADLEALVQEYPYFTAGHLLLLKAYKQQNSIHFKKQLRKVAAIAPDRAQVYALTEAWPETESVEVDEMGEKTAVVEALQASAPATEEVPAATPLLEALATEELEEAATASGEVPILVDEEVAEPEAEATANAPEEAELVFAFDPEKDQIEPEGSAGMPEEDLLALVEELASQPATASEEMLSEVELTADEEGALHFAFEPAAAETTEAPLATEEEVAEEVETTAYMQPIQEDAEESPASEPEEVLPTFETTIPAAEAPRVAAPMAASAPEFTEDYAVFVARPHDRLSWFRFFAGKPLREQPDEVLEQLYMEHMQQDLLQAPAENPVEDIKVRVNKAEEVASSREMEEEIKRLAYDSISDDELPASETLARIYEQQQEYKRAIKIYQKLILKFPDKMTYFAGLIESLRQK